MLITAGYCLTTGVIPRGLSLGDIATTLVVTLAFGLFYLLAVGSSICSLIWLVALVCGVRHSWHKIRRLVPAGQPPAAAQPTAATEHSIPRLKRTVQPWSIVLGSFILFAVVALMLWLLLANSTSSGGRRVLMLFTMFPTSGFTLAVVLFVEKDDKTAPSRRGVLAIAALVLAPAIALPEVLIEVTMGFAGIRQARKAVIVSNDNLARLQMAAESAGTSIRVCRPVQGAESIVYDLDLQWHGIGDTTYVRLVVDEGGWNRSPRFVTAELKAEGVSLLRSNLKLKCPLAPIAHPGPQPSS